MRTNQLPLMTQALVAAEFFESDNLVLAYIGENRGFEDYWRIYRTQLRVYGFTGLKAASDGVNDDPDDDRVKYFSALMGATTPDSGVPEEYRQDRKLARDTGVYPRTSARRYQREHNYSADVASFTSGSAKLNLDDQDTSIDQFFSQPGSVAPDFIRVDSKRNCLQTLLGSRETMRSSPVLGVLVNTQFQGVLHPNADTLPNIVNFMHELGLSLFDIRPHRYSRGCLPSQFESDLPTGTVSGQVLWGELLFFRDLGLPNYREIFEVNLTPFSILKLASLMELFGLPDCAAEVITANRDTFGQALDANQLLDLLVPKLDGREVSYEEYNDHFSCFPDSFLGTSTDKRERD